MEINDPWPDPVIKTPEKAIVLDVTVRFEQDNSLSEAADKKATTKKYQATLRNVMRDMGSSLPKCCLLSLVQEVDSQTSR